MGAPMQGIRALTNRHRTAALWLFALALLVKAVVPAGYMVGQSDVPDRQIHHAKAGRPF